MSITLAFPSREGLQSASSSCRNWGSVPALSLAHRVNYHFWNKYVLKDCQSHIHHRYCPEVAWQSIQLIQKHLRWTADQDPSWFFVARSSCLNYLQAWLDKPYCLQLPLQLQICPSASCSMAEKRAIESHCLGANWEICITKLYSKRYLSRDEHNDAITRCHREAACSNIRQIICSMSPTKDLWRKLLS